VSDTLGTHLLISGSLAFCIGLFLFLIVALDYPLQGSLSIGSDAFQANASVTGG
jgi:hypothetical protein